NPPAAPRDAIPAPAPAEKLPAAPAPAPAQRIRAVAPAILPAGPPVALPGPVGKPVAPLWAVPNQITLQDGKPEGYAAHYAGAARVRARVSPRTNPAAGRLDL